ncbi:MAG: hypothetical protein P8Y23_00505 [Candidatus Lokiarchaeota archaeon]|jgi:hypothetical protein
MDVAIILIVLLAIGFLVAVRIVGINKGEKNPEEDEDCQEDDVVDKEE